ncbi:Uncharacterized conserved protein YecT, DUF1311 family [Pseudoxanthomonas sp. GM95]|uniref:lysozyme inhibitor LprI family protein n=1 Tax=Pseudoxanthomonas sp. GM95 TaxID=1881043 RepID=UPI0008D08C0F|nr:lysozyme inhibitor LprI family protein [Pseudoxanthomonas sp. GM95]SEL77145.1 Uncharacterized conserved protein YecT, DUF1311 family [Pseudoxanthomonas sp. GM95]
MRAAYSLLTVASLLLVCPFALADQPPVDRDVEMALCKGANTQYDVTQCAGDVYEAADKELNAAYQAVLKKWANYPDVTGKLRQAQRDWLTYRDADVEARFAFEDSEGAMRGTAYPAAYAFYRASLARERTARLCQYLRGTAYGEVDRSACTDLVKHPYVIPAPTH